MPKFQAREASESRLIPEDVLVRAVVRKIEDATYQYDGKDVPQLKFQFEVTEPGEWHEWMLYGKTSQKFVNHEKCKLMNWAVALTGREYPEGAELDTDDLVGMACRVGVEHQPDKKDPEKIWMNVVVVLPPKSTRTATDVF